MEETGGQSNGQVLTEEKLCETGTRRQHAPQKSIRCLAQEMGFQVLSVLYFQKLTSVHGNARNAFITTKSICDLSCNQGKFCFAIC